MYRKNILGKIAADGDNACHFPPLVGFDETGKFHHGAFDAVRGNFSRPDGTGKSLSFVRAIKPMRLRFLICFVMLTASSAFGGDWQHAPRSENFAVHEKFTGKPAPVVLSSAKDRLFRTVLRQQAKKGPNFAGHYTMVVVGCGMDSFFVAIVDAKTGRVHWPPFGCISLAGGFGIPLPEGKRDSPNPAFRIDSRLFLTVGLEDKEDAELKDRAVQFWVFDNGRFSLSYSIPAPFQYDEHAQ